MKYLIRALQFIFALTFVASGWAKCIDPSGTAIKLSEYLQYFGLGILTDFSMGLSWVLCILEFICGFHLLLGHARISSLIVCTFLMVLFTPITLWLAITDAIRDCGCFGDLIHLSNGQTLAKNVLLDIILFLLWWRHQYLYRILGGTAFTVCRYWAFALIVWLCWTGTYREPYIDFRPYRTGTDLISALGMERHAEGEKEGTVEEQQPVYTCIYRKDGVTREFPLDSIPDEADGWEFVDTVEHGAASFSATAEKGASIDLYLKNEQGEVVTSSVLQYPGYTLLMLSPSLDDASQHDIDRIESLSEYAFDNDYPFYCVTASDTAQLNRWIHNTGAEYPFLFTDVTIIQTICRSNPGVMLLREGVICWKKPLSVLDTEQLTSAKLSKQTSGEIEEINVERQILWLLILMFAPIVLFLLFEIPKKISNINPKKDSKDA